MRGRSSRCNSLAKPNWFLDRFGLKRRQLGGGLQIIDLNEIGEINDLCFQSRDVSLFGQPLRRCTPLSLRSGVRFPIMDS
jgi:hypothetical protein